MVIDRSKLMIKLILTNEKKNIVWVLLSFRGILYLNSHQILTDAASRSTRRPPSCVRLLKIRFSKICIPGQIVYQTALYVAIYLKANLVAFLGARLMKYTHTTGRVKRLTCAPLLISFGRA